MTNLQELNQPSKNAYCHYWENSDSQIALKVTSKEELPKIHWHGASLPGETQAESVAVPDGRSLVCLPQILAATQERGCFLGRGCPARVSYLSTPPLSTHARQECHFWAKWQGERCAFPTLAHFPAGSRVWIPPTPQGRVETKEEKNLDQNRFYPLLKHEVHFNLVSVKIWRVICYSG